jgi:predicted transcriptional regulator YdeE
LNSTAIIKVELVERQAVYIVGMEKFIDREQGGMKGEIEIPKLWQEFNQRRGELEDIAVPCGTYGLMTYKPPFGPNQNMHYLAGIEVTTIENLPEGMVWRLVPAHQFAVITYRGPVSGMMAAWDYFHSHWLPQSGYTAVDEFEFEYYDQRYLGPDHADTEIDIYFPVK